MSTQQLLGKLRQPQYTGANRCIPCTVVNVLIAAVISGLIGLVSPPLMVASFVLFTGTIYVRGYLIPGTPTLTQRYLPDTVLRWFDKEPGVDLGIHVTADDQVDVERLLRDVGVLESCSRDEDLCLTDEFRDAWHETATELTEERAKTRLASLLAIPPTDLAIQDAGRAKTVVRYRNEIVGQWESRAAFIADMASESLLGEWVGNWLTLSLGQRSQVYRGLRVYIDQCPECSGTVSLNEETVKSCCRSREVYASTCQECGARLFEVNAVDVEAATA